MANLTGQYDVATELGVGLMNCLLAAIHENQDDAYPRFPHSFSVRVNDVYRGAGDPVPEADRTGVQTAAEVQASTPTISLPLEGWAHPIWSQSRAPVMTAVQADRGRTGPIGSTGPVHPGPRRQTCWPRITVQIRLRVWLRDTPATLPKFLHGDLYLTAGVARTDLTGGGTFLGLDHSNPAVRFDPAGGTTLSDEQRTLVERILRNFIRGDSEPASFKLALPPEVRRFDYQLEPTGPLPSALLMFRLSGSPEGPGSVSARFLPPGADFAVAIGRDYLLAQLRAELLQGLPSVFTASGTGFHAQVKPDWNGATFDLQPGRIVFSVSGSGSVTYGGWIFETTDHWTFTIRQAFALHVDNGVLKPALIGDPEVELHDVAVFAGTIRDKARDAIKTELQTRLDPPPPALQKALDVGKPLGELIGALHPDSPGVALTGADIRPDGVVVPGTVALAPSRPVEVRRVGLNGFADALESWIPGGTIERFVWGTRVEEHRFVTEKPLAVSAGLRCLSVEGTRVTRGGALVPVSAEDCPVVVATFPVVGLPPPGGPCERPLLPLLAGAPNGRVDVVGHYDPWASGLVPPAGPTNLLVHFADGPWEDAAKALDEALAAAKSADAALILVGVLEKGRLPHAAKGALEADATLLLTEDPSARWAAAFGVSQAPATVLVGPAGEVRWKDEAPLDPVELGRVLAEQLERGGDVSWRALGLAVSASDRTPDVPLRLEDGRELALRRLRGGSVVLSFWTSCSGPSIEQLRQLREALKSGRQDQPSVLGIGDGETREQVMELAKREQLPFELIADPERLIARRFGVSCWPTTVQVGADGTVVAADLGLFPGVSPCVQPVINVRDF